ncbi:MAG: peptidoglycan DD-metalloendopeptidase family protein [Bacteroidaceae bacterium]|nr:peptidoglycan DD-metalloendopeptidase family protein [Bacteroidaceae bacterium]
MKKFFLRIFIIGALLLACGTTAPQKAEAQKVTNSSIKKLQKQQAALQSKIKESERQLKTTKKSVQAQLSTLMEINSQITEKKNYVAGIQQQVDTMARKVAVLEQELARLQKDLDVCKARFQKGAMYMYRNKMMQNKLMFIFSAKSFRQMYKRMRYMLEYTKYQRAQGLIIKEKEEAVKKKREEVVSAKTEKERLAAQGRAEQKQLEGKQVERQKVVDELNKKSKQLQSAIAENKKKNANLNAKIDQLIQEEIRRQEAKRKAEEAKRKAEEERRKAAEAAAAQGKKGGKGGKGKGKAEPYVNGNAGSGGSFRPADNADRQLSNNFASNKGRLPVPITGPYRITGRYGQNAIEGLSGVSIPNNGTNYTGQAGAQARAVFDGEVTAVFSYGGMTNVIIRHGSYMSVYCNLSGVSVRKGQKVSTRQTIGTVARDASGGYTLQFQLRKETSKLNPEGWIAR